MNEILNEFQDVIDYIYGEYAIYLRKSRADLEAEARGEGETLARHLRILLELARRLHIKIGAIYHEVVSGENIIDRPQVQIVLKEVRMARWKGILVVEVERLGRGNTIDQGTVAEAFAISHTKIVTPMKTYDPDNEYDQEYFEFGLFMSRREYKVINRRLQTGRKASVNEGKFVGNIAPYGWDRIKIKNGKGFTLTTNDETKTMQFMYDSFAYNDISLRELGRRLDNMGIRPRKGEKWNVSTIRDILRNPVNIGMIRWDWRKTVKQYKNGQIVKRRPRNNSGCILVKGLQPAAVKKETWDIVQRKLDLNASYIVEKRDIMKNPLSGLVICAKCGKPMQRRPYTLAGKEDGLICTNTKCNNIGSKLQIVEEKVVESLKKWLSDYNIELENYGNELKNQKIQNIEDTIINLKRELEKQNRKNVRLYELLEDGIYSKEVFMERSKDLAEQITRLKDIIRNQEEDVKIQKELLERRKEWIPTVKNVIDLYNTLETAEEKNKLLKTVIEKVVYLKTEKAIKRDSDPTRFELDIFPKVMKTLQN